MWYSGSSILDSRFSIQVLLARGYLYVERRGRGKKRWGMRSFQLRSSVWVSRVCAGDGSHLEKRSCDGNSVGNGENRWVEAWNASINSCRSGVFRRRHYIYVCARDWKRKKSWRGRQTRCNSIETFIRSPSYIKDRPLKMRWRDNLIWAGADRSANPQRRFSARGEEAWKERMVKRVVEERNGSFPFLSRWKGEIWERSVLEEAWNDRFPYENARNTTIFVREAAAPLSSILSLRIVFSLFVRFPFLSSFLSFNGISRMGAIKMLVREDWCTGRLLRSRGEIAPGIEKWKGKVAADSAGKFNWN